MNKAKKIENFFTYKSVRIFAVALVVTALLFDSFLPRVVHAGAKNLSEIFTYERPVYPNADPRQPMSTVSVVATAYNSLPEQTDDTPFITASGTRTRHGVVAANFLHIGTRVRFPDVYGATVFVVEDRMNSRYGNGRVDIWMEDYGDARIFGAKRLTMEIF